METLGILVVAIGGNALMRQGEKGSFEDQYNNVQLAIKEVADVIEKGYRVVLTHGNGPQVGAALLRHKMADDIYPALPLHACDAETQGLIGYMIEQALQNELNRRHIDQSVATVITRVTIDREDQAFRNPTKPVGKPIFGKEMRDLTFCNTLQLVAKNSNEGYQLVVPSPKPISILEYKAIRTLMDEGFVVIACGGGGIPVMESNGLAIGSDAVIDKDLVSERLATLIGARKLVLLTNVDGVYQNYGKKNQKLISKIGVSKSSQFDVHKLQEGSMGPKVQACMTFIKEGGNEAIIAKLGRLLDALSGFSGTHFVP
ncbi:carbamate kinase [soil metagenome]